MAGEGNDSMAPERLTPPPSVNGEREIPKKRDLLDLVKSTKAELQQRTQSLVAIGQRTYKDAEHGYYEQDGEPRSIGFVVNEAVNSVNERLVATGKAELPALDYLKQSSDVLANYTYLSNGIKETLPKYEERLQSYTRELDDLNKKLSSGSMSEDELAKKAELEETLETIRANLEEGHMAGTILSTNRPVFEVVSRRNKNTALSEATKEVKAMAGAYVHLKKGVLDDDTIGQQVRESFVRDIMEARLKEHNAQGYISGPSVGELRYHMETLLQLAASGNKERYEEHCQRVREVPGFPTDIFKELLEGEDENIVGALVSHVAAEDLDRARWDVHGAFINTPINGDMNEMLRGIVFANPISYALQKEQDDVPFSQVSVPQIFTTTNNFKFLEMWTVLKKSPEAQRVFGDTIKKVDSEIYDLIMKSSLNDETGFFMAGLGYYPTPEAVRNLVLIAVGSDNYSRRTAIGTAMETLKSRPDIKGVLKEAVATYPDLEGIEDVIENWSGLNYSRFQQNDELSLIGASIAHTVIDSPESYSPEVIDLAKKSLHTQVLLEKLLSKGAIDEHAIDVLLTPFREEFEDVLKRNYKTSEYSSASKRVTDLQLMVRNSALTVDFENPKDEELNKIRRVARLISAIQSESNNPQALQYLLSAEVLSAISTFSRLTDEHVELMLTAHHTYPVLGENNDLRSGFIRHFTQFSTEEGFSFFGQFYEKFKGAYSYSPVLLSLLETGDLSRELILAIPDQARLLMDEKNKNIGAYVFQHTKILISDPSDLRFLNTFIGMHGNKADSLVRGYKDCVEAGIVTRENRQEVLEFTQKFRVLSPDIVKLYLSAKNSGNEAVFLAELRTISEKLTGAGRITDEERSKPYYQDLLKHVYPNNAGGDVLAVTRNCQDRSQDLAQFTVKPRYEIDLLSASEIRVKAGETVDLEVIERLKNKILEAGKVVIGADLDSEKIKVALSDQVDKALVTARESGSLQGIDLDKVTTLEDKLFVLLADSTYGSRVMDTEKLKSLLIAYEFTDQDFRTYVEGTTDRVSRASNQDYALLCELNAFYSDRLKEVNRKLVQSASNNPEVSKAMETYFKNFSEETLTQQRRQEISNLQLDRLGLSDSFINQLSRLLRGRTGRTYTPEQVRRIVSKYEGVTSGLVDKRTIDRERIADQKDQTPRGSRTREELTQAFYGQLKTQRDKTIEAARIIADQEFDPRVHLGEINLQQLMDIQKDLNSGEYHPDQFASYTAQRFIDLFDDEINATRTELDKFESATGKEREVLYGYIAKTKETANARAVGGVCVYSDNPGYGPTGQNQWEMPNYLQLVLQDPETYQCQGVVLLHHYTDETGKRVLAASLNPSSTYLYTVDEEAMFNGLLGTLGQFAADNKFDMITTSTNTGIRTNRTGGKFEQALDSRIRDIRANYRFSKPETFSYNPPYQVQDMDVIWQRPTV